MLPRDATEEDEEHTNLEDISSSITLAQCLFESSKHVLEVRKGALPSPASSRIKEVICLNTTGYRCQGHIH